MEESMFWETHTQQNAYPRAVFKGTFSWYGLAFLLAVLVLFLVLSIFKDAFFATSAPRTGSAAQLQRSSLNEMGYSPPKVIVNELPAVFADEVVSVTHDFSIFNDSDKTIRLGKPEHSCACSSVRLEKRELQPGEAAKLYMEINLSGRSGLQNFTCFLPTDSGISWKCELRANIYQREAVVPCEVNFGKIEPGKVLSRNISLVFCDNNLNATEPKIAGIRTQSNCVKGAAGKVATETLPTGVQKWITPITVKLAPQTVHGVGSTEIVVTCQRGSERKDFAIPVMWNLKSAFSVSPQRIFFGKITDTTRDTTPIVRKAIVRREDNQAFQVRKATCTKGDVALTVRDLNASKLIELSLSPESIPGDLFGELVLETDNVVQPEVRIPFCAFR
jgi:hypothetical protein